ncbi:sugar ABC transporter substrate-binding protein [Tessaracoccus defluvii]|uniref:Extracellular solute-binding protein n=1 Tax=Tessaracoccus defluvii TaxID=1285901 RepID=A0A7H0H689_9ACTN|nr:extracellular solute-binding protein [Tessaracoccus defluvii]QNP56055.1 extracellular solute-binding protein [Tessaracoccus defluvii]
MPIKEDQMNRKKMAVMLGASVLALAVSACGGGGTGPDGGASGKTQMLAWHGYTEADGKVLDKIVAEFNSSQDACEVNAEAIAWGSITEKLVTSLGAGNGPNLVVQGPDTGLGYVNQGAFQDVQSYYDDPETYTSVPALHSNLADAVTWDGKTYAIPMGTAAYAVYYNKTMWAEAGLTDADIPKTIDEMLDVAKKLTKGEKYGIAAPDKDAIFLATILHSGGGDFITDGKVNLNSPENIATLEKWQSAFVDDKVSPTGMDQTAAMELYGSGRAGMIMNGPWQITSSESFGIDTGVFGWPSDWVAGVLNYWWSTSMNDSDAEKACANSFGDFWNSRDMQILWQDSFYPPNRSDIPAEEFKDPRIATLAEYSQFAHYYMSGVESNFNDISSTTNALMEQVSQGGDVAELVAAAQTKVEGYIG